MLCAPRLNHIVLSRSIINVNYFVLYDNLINIYYYITLTLLVSIILIQNIKCYLFETA